MLLKTVEVSEQIDRPRPNRSGLGADLESVASVPNGGFKEIGKGEFPEFFDLPKYECMDVDEEEDFKVAEQLYYTFVGRTPRMTEEVEAYHE